MCRVSIIYGNYKILNSRATNFFERWYQDNSTTAQMYWISLTLVSDNWSQGWNYYRWHVSWNGSIYFCLILTISDSWHQKNPQKKEMVSLANLTRPCLKLVKHHKLFFRLVAFFLMYCRETKGSKSPCR